MQLITKETLLPFLQQHLPSNPIIVEAGSFDGRDTKKLAAFWPQATIHAFEPVPDIFKLLEQNTISIPNIHRYPYALSDANGTAEFHVAESPKKPGAPCQAGSLLAPKERLAHSPITYPKTMQVSTITLDTWAQQQNIDHIDLLWLDMQGYELNVMKASPKMLATVRAVYTEVEFIEAYAGQYLYEDVKAWMEAHGFVMGAKDWQEESKWFYGNALFFRK